ncbi:MAG: dynamin family protein [Clostridia bacterium]|nr:dynamin family protein [Clostridia bacterium]
MAVVKIVSNPYEKKVSFFRLDDISTSWMPVNAVNNENSKLISSDLTDGFFPFKVKEIIDIIITEYDDGEGPIKIVFEGTNDEYNELVSLYSGEEYKGKISVKQSTRYIENAREILPDIIGIFKELNPIINDSIGSEKIAGDLERFSDASSDVIPICVIGNYSAGKSTFINALIGKEILPSGENPITAKIFKITQSESENTAKVKFEFDGSPIVINFNGASYNFDGLEEDNKITTLIKKALDDSEDNNLIRNIYDVLTVINDFSVDDDADLVGNLIEVEVFFNSYISNNSNIPFMVFDTPGSNSVSNKKHLEVLKEAMAGMSNGIPVFVSEYSKLDTTDNEGLFNIFNSIDNLDNRFAMIIVNKADVAGLPPKGFSEADERKTLRLFIPKSLYSGGIYFVSSLMGLGSKNNGNFIDEYSSETFEKAKPNYSDPADKYYKSLYLYDIMPGQIKKAAVSSAKAQTNLIYANSGLFCIENDILTFAKKYSSYDKCTQSQMFLNSILDKTVDELTAKKNDAETRKTNSIDLFNKHKEDLIEKLETSGEKFFEDSSNNYPVAMSSTVSSCESEIKKNELESQLKEITEQLKLMKNYEGLKSEKASSQKKVLSNFFENSIDVFKEKMKKESLKKLNDTLKENQKDAKEDSDELKEALRQISEEASETLLQRIIDLYEEKTERAQKVINAHSIEYWNIKTKAARELLQNVVSDSRGINEDEIAELSNIILEFPELVLSENKAEEIFAIENFKKKLLFSDNVKLKLEKLANVYTREYGDFLKNLVNNTNSDHASGFRAWLGMLLSKLKDNVVTYNQILRDEQLLIDKLIEEINSLEEKQSLLNNGISKISEMISWKEA